MSHSRVIIGFRHITLLRFLHMNSRVYKISFILPVLNESSLIRQQLQRLQCYRKLGHELVVIDGGSEDGTLEMATPLADKVDQTPAGRSRQMNRGAELASGNLLLFLHVDTLLPDAAPRLIADALDARKGKGLAETNQPTWQWGWFDVSFSNRRFPYRVIAAMMNLRARLTGVCTGDQALFVSRELFLELGMFADIPIMEDVAASKSLRRLSRPVTLSTKVEASSRRWEERGLIRTVLLMWWLRLLYFLGVKPSRLVQRYYPDSRLSG